MKVAIMQPYTFPYIGYFQLIDAVDYFVFYDDVDYIKGGWVNRNKILINRKENLFTIPLNKSSSFKPINKTELHPVLYTKWTKKFLKTLEQAYKKAPYFDKVYPLINDVLTSKQGSISSLAIHSIIIFLEYLGYKRKIFVSSIDFKKINDLNREDRLIEICRKLDAKIYINVSGGRELYDKEYFRYRNIDLFFIEQGLAEYDQQNESFVQGLSIIDVLMNNSIPNARKLIKNYKII